MQDYKKLKVWEKSHHLTLGLYKITNNFPKEERYGLINQMRRASVSIPANIAEGCGKFSDADTCKFFQIALGSTQEVEYYILLGKDLNYINENDFTTYNSLINEIKSMLIVLIKKSRERIV